MSGDRPGEVDETVDVTISLPEPDVNGGGTAEHPVAIAGGVTATVKGTITDDDPAVVTVAPKYDSVFEGQDAVFVLTRTGVTDDALSVQVRLYALDMVMLAGGQ